MQETYTTGKYCFRVQLKWNLNSVRSELFFMSNKWTELLRIVFFNHSNQTSHCSLHFRGQLVVLYKGVLYKKELSVLAFQHSSTGSLNDNLWLSN